MNRIKAILTDLDGTVVLPQSDIVSERVVSAAQQAENNGIIICAVTGRYFEIAKGVINILGISNPCVVSGGSEIIDPTTGKILWSQMVSESKLRYIYSLLAPYANRISLGNGLDSGIDNKKIVVEDIVKPSSHAWASVPVEIASSLISSINEDNELIAHANAGPGGDFTKVGIQVTHRRADKEHGVNQLLNLLNISSENIMAIGDGDNDLPLFRNAGFKVAMGNASGLLKAEADEVVGKINEDGFAEAIERFVVIKR